MIRLLKENDSLYIYQPAQDESVVVYREELEQLIAQLIAEFNGLNKE